MPLIDTRFLTVHPRTALWWEQREQCRLCKNKIDVPSKPKDGNGGTGHGMRCLKARFPHDASCISSREPGTPCGPDAKLFERKQEC